MFFVWSQVKKKLDSMVRVQAANVLVASDAASGLEAKAREREPRGTPTSWRVNPTLIVFSRESCCS